MSRQAKEYTIEQPLNDVCGGCAVRANDPFVKERVGIWQHGPRFKVYMTGNLRQLMNSFERHYNVPPMPFIPTQWQNWLDRHQCYQTLCVRCALERGFDPPEAGIGPERCGERRRSGGFFWRAGRDASVHVAVTDRRVVW
ncbi:unnamed protein product [Durusdinium trenchii]|uniref:Uncharacterized protein n=2 Tax=Durusdinium trenchii TaxID=1381693 RepID=A0ABP0MM18_9DINO